MSAWTWQWEQEGVRFDLRHQSLVGEDWMSSQRQCTIDADLYLPSQMITATRVLGTVRGVALKAGDVVKASAIDFGAGRRTAQVTLAVVRSRNLVASGVARFWRATTLPGPRDLTARLTARIRGAVPVDEYGDALPMDSAEGVLRLRDLEYAEQTRALALAAGLPADLAQLLQDGWAHLGYQEGLRDAAQTPPIGDRTQRLDTGRRQQAAKGEPDRRLARQIIWQEQSAGRVIDLRTCAKATLARWQEISSQNPEDPSATAGVYKGVAGIERTIGKLFAHKDAKSRRLAYLLVEDPELQLDQP